MSERGTHLGPRSLWRPDQCRDGPMCAQKKSRGRGDPRLGSQLWGGVRRGGRTVERLGLASGVEEGGGNLLRGYPRLTALRQTLSPTEPSFYVSPLKTTASRPIPDATNELSPYEAKSKKYSVHSSV